MTTEILDEILKEEARRKDKVSRFVVIANSFWVFFLLTIFILPQYTLAPCLLSVCIASVAAAIWQAIYIDGKYGIFDKAERRVYLTCAYISTLVLMLLMFAYVVFSTFFVNLPWFTFISIVPYAVAMEFTGRGLRKIFGSTRSTPFADGVGEYLRYPNEAASKYSLWPWPRRQ